jgi:integrase
MKRRAKGRSNGEGSIYEYPEGSGIWYAQVRVEGAAPKRRRAKTQRDAREKLKQLLAELEQGVDLTMKQPTVEQWCTTWLDTFAVNLKPTIKEDYAGVIKRCIKDTRLGRRRLNQLTPADVQGWVNELSKRLAAQSVRNAHARLHKALVVAVRQRYIARNVADNIELPSVRTPPITPLDFEQAQAFLAFLKGHRWEVAYWLALNLGMRRGEILGLAWEALDLDTGTLRVFQQLQRLTGSDGQRAFILQTTKTRAGDRLLQLDDDLTALLRAHKHNQDEERALLGEHWKNRLNLVFVTETGAPIHFSDLVKQFKGALKKAELPNIRFHDLRHTAATLLLADGVPLVTVSKILGHSSPAITATIYAHALDDHKASAIAGLAKRLRNGAKSQ